MDDLLRDPFSELERIDLANRQRIEVLESLVAEDQEYERIWNSAVSLEHEVDGFYFLGVELRRRQHEFWVDLILLYLERQRIASGSDRYIAQHLALAAAVQIIRAAIQGDRPLLETLLEQAHSTIHHEILQSQFVSIKDNVKFWGDARHFPATPMVTRQELIKACRDIRGMSEPRVSVLIRKGTLTTETREGRYAAFRHQSDAKQLKILEAILNFFA